MQEKELKNIWKKFSEQDNNSITNQKLINAMKTKMNQFDRKIKQRDWKENIAGIILFVIFSFLTVYYPQLQVKIGAMILAFSCLLIIYTLKKTRSLKEKYGKEVEYSTKEYLERQIYKVDKQIDLLKRKSLWGLVLLSTGALLFSTGLPRDLVDKITFILIMLLVYTGIYLMNLREVKKKLLPLKKELEAKLKEF